MHQSKHPDHSSAELDKVKPRDGVQQPDYNKIGISLVWFALEVAGQQVGHHVFEVLLLVYVDHRDQDREGIL